MTRRDEAVLLDASDRPVEALVAYEEALLKGELSLDDCLNVAGLCLELADPGYASAVGVTDMRTLPDVKTIAFRVLMEAEDRFGPSADVVFMRAYARWTLDGVLPPEDFLAGVGEFRTFRWGTYWEAIMGTCRDEERIRALLRSIEGESVVAKRRLMSILQGCLSQLSRQSPRETTG
jgi:hypothetical protein